MEASVWLGWQANFLLAHLAFLDAIVPGYESLGVETQSIDEVDDGPFIPVVFPRSERPTSYQDHLQEEEKIGYGCRWLSSEGNRKSPVLDQPSSLQN